MKLRILIVDDELLARRRLTTMLRDIVDVEIVGEAADGDVALDLVREKAPDVVLLDIKMPGRNGFDLLPLLEGPDIPVIIFVTAFNHYAVRAFEVSAVDYLLKPVAFDRMREALERARATLRSRDAQSRIAEMAEVLSALRDNPGIEPQGAVLEREFWVQRRGEYVRVPIAQIEWVGAERDYVRLHAGNDAYLMRETMNRIEERLDPATFIRVHRSALVRRQIITAIRQAGYGALKVVLSNGTEVSVGRTYAPGIRDLLNRKSSIDC
ncbi:LytR/AlgR family response regulator transcription factor [Sphingomonas cavernae]|uniref:DNA-binding response regulator n=1 Tax=Sphingomonas cavernae TaxID=2320861 RepID=A0A418WJN5_9SPHN|nr:LytTR family DNA-binding domain-containing protein [Sphingomonas cavernae]RJF90210.1 DNA-binding response regulator [Sphingomonas cavernae]